MSTQSRGHATLDMLFPPSPTKPVAHGSSNETSIRDYHDSLYLAFPRRIGRAERSHGYFGCRENRQLHRRRRRHGRDGFFVPGDRRNSSPRCDCTDHAGVYAGCKVSDSSIRVGNCMWQLYDNGSTLGQRGSEEGLILRDEEYDLGARITLEGDCSRGVPFAATCGIYGWFFHTRLLGSEAEAEFSDMQNGLVAILNMIPRADDPFADSKMSPVSDAISAFVS